MSYKMIKKINSNFKNKYFLLIILILIYLTLRIFFLFSMNLANLEECLTGTMAKEMISGLEMPIFDYPIFFGPHYPGRIFSGLITVPFYILFGESGISLKLMFLTVSAGIVCLVYLFLSKFFSRKAAIISSILMIFSIPVYTLSTLSQGGPHLETVFFNILIMFLFYKIFFDNKQDTKSFIIFGLISGFAIFVNLSILTMIFTCFLFWFIFDKKFFLRKHFFIFFTFFTIGSSLFIYYNVTHDFIGLHYMGRESFLSKIVDNELSVHRINQIFIKFKNLITYDIPKSFMFKDLAFLSANFFSYTYLFLFIGAFTLLFYNCRKSIFKLILGLIPLKKFNVKPTKIKKEIFILVYPTIFIFIYTLANFSVDHNRFGADCYRYLLTFYIFIFIIISLFLSKLYNKKTKLISILLIITLILFGIVSNLNFVSFKDMGKNVIYRPYCYDQLGPTYKNKTYNHSNKSYQSFYFAGRAMAIRARIGTLNVNEMIEYCNSLDKRYRCFCYSGINQLIYSDFREDVEDKLQYNNIDKNYRCCSYEGIGWTYSAMLVRNYIDAPQVCEGVNKYLKPYCFEGFGQGMGKFIGAIPSQAIRECNKIEEEYRPYCFKGLAWSITEKFGDNPTRAGKICEELNEKFRPYCYEGIGSYIRLMFLYNLSIASEECNKLGENSIYCYKGLDNSL